MYYNEKIRWVRKRMKISQKEVAHYLNIKQQQYSRYEKGTNNMPSAYLSKICEYLNVSADYILGIKFNNETKKEDKDFY